MKKQKSVIFLSLLFFSCLSPNPRGVFTSAESDFLKIKGDFSTLSEEIKYGKTVDSFLCIFEKSAVHFDEDGVTLKQGTLLKSNYYSKKNRLKKIQCDTVFTAQTGEFILFRVILPSYFHTQSTEVEIQYEHPDRGPDKKISKLFHYYSENRENFYGCYLPFHPLSSSQSYSLRVILKFSNHPPIEIQSKSPIKQKEFPQQTLRFSKSKSKELSSSDRSKYKKEQNFRMTLWNQLTNPIQRREEIAPPLKNRKRVTSEFAFTRRWMLENGKLYSRDTHLGVDYGAPMNTPAYSILEGTVVLAQKQELYGNMVIIDHGMGLYSNYCHLNKIETTAGEKVKKGEIIGLVGMTGAATGPHLHVETRIYGIPIDYRTLYHLPAIYNKK